MFRILTLNNIAKVGLDQLPTDRYQIHNDIADPHVILVRSSSMHGREILPSLRAVGRAGAGVNNIPLPDMTARNVVVFNTPGANANAVKELVLAGMLMASRNLPQAWAFARGLEGTDEELHKAVEAGKKNYVGSELLGKTLAVIGLGAIGRLVGATAVAFGMRVVGYDPALPESAALPAGVKRVSSLEQAITGANFLTVHVPINAHTRGLIGATQIGQLAERAIVLNFSREGIVDEAAMVAALDAKRAHAYVSDFPVNATKNHAKCITLPHLGASTDEAEENCAAMIVQQVQDFLENGNIRNSVNFPDVSIARGTAHRIAITHDNVPSMLAHISDVLGQAGLNIHDMANGSRGDLAYTLIDVDGAVGEEVVLKVAAVAGVRRAERLVAI